MRYIRPAALALAISAALISPIAHAAVMTNADVIKLIDAGMPESVIIQSITSSTPRFDTSADALIKLKQKGATPAVLSAMISPQTKVGGGTAQPVAAAGGLNPEEVILDMNGKETPMQYIVPQMRTAARALGFGGIATYTSLQGTRASLRLPAQGFSLIVSVPKNAQVQSYMTLASFVERKNGTREVSTGGGYMSYSTGINKSHVIAIKSEQLPDQLRARSGFVLYRITPEASLPSGEYALVLYTAEIRTTGFFASGANSCFDFGVD